MRDFSPLALYKYTINFEPERNHGYPRDSLKDLTSIHVESECKLGDIV